MDTSIYLETSFISACVTHLGDGLSLRRRSASLDWWHQEAARHRLYTSAAVIAELQYFELFRREEALELVGDLPLLEIAPGVEVLASVCSKFAPTWDFAHGLHAGLVSEHIISHLMTWDGLFHDCRSHAWGAAMCICPPMEYPRYRLDRIVNELSMIRREMLGRCGGNLKVLFEQLHQIERAHTERLMLPSHQFSYI